MYKTRHFPAEFSQATERQFVYRALAHYSARALKRRIVAVFKPGSDQWRTPGSVATSYDAERGYTLERIDALTFEELVYGSADRFDAVPEFDFILLEDKVQWARTRESRAYLVEEMAARIAELVPPGGTVMEFGSGSGRNLLYLKSRLRDRAFVGLELSPVSVQLARRLSDHLQLPVRFEVANVCEPLPHGLPGADLVFSSHALEMMPRIFVGAIDNMLSIATHHVLFFEPVPELWPTSSRGLASKARAYAMDRLRGFMPEVAKRASAKGWSVAEASRLRTSTNPINETAIVRLERRRTDRTPPA